MTIYIIDEVTSGLRRVRPGSARADSRPRGTKAQVAGYRAAFSDLQVTRRAAGSESAYVAGPHAERYDGELFGMAPTGNVIGDGNPISRIVDGKVVEDYLGMECARPHAAASAPFPDGLELVLGRSGHAARGPLRRRLGLGPASLAGREDGRVRRQLNRPGREHVPQRDLAGGRRRVVPAAAADRRQEGGRACRAGRPTARASPSRRTATATTSSSMCSPLGGGEPSASRSSRRDVERPAWSPDGTPLAFAARVPDPAYEEEDEKKRLPRRFTRHRYKLDSVGWTGDRPHAHLRRAGRRLSRAAAADGRRLRERGADVVAGLEADRIRLRARRRLGRAAAAADLGRGRCRRRARAG